MTEPTSPARDSSRRNRKAPGNVALSHLTAPRVECSASGGQAPAIVLAAEFLAKTAHGGNLPAVALTDSADFAAVLADLQSVGDSNTQRQILRPIRPQIAAVDLRRPTAR